MKRCVIIVILVLLSGFGLFLVRMVRKTEIPGTLVISQIHSGDQTTHFICPKGDRFNFVMGILPSQKGVSEIAGRLFLTCEGKSPLSLLFDTTNSTHCNWLERDGVLDGYILNWPIHGAGARLDDYFISGKSVRVEVEVTNSFEGSASLWLSYLSHW